MITMKNFPIGGVRRTPPIMRDLISYRERDVERYILFSVY